MNRVEHDYLALLRELLLTGEPHADRTGVGTRSLWGRTLRADLRQGFPLLTTKEVFMRGVAEELRWFLLGRSDVQWLQERRVKIWDEWATAEKCAEFGRKAGDLGPVYGPMWRAFPIGAPCWDDASISDFRAFSEVPVGAHNYRCDQVKQLLDDLEASPNSRRLLVTAWHPFWSRRATLPPCHVLWQLKVHAGAGACGRDEMSIAVYMRSVDTFLGMPFDLASYALLLSLLCRATGREPRDVVMFFADCHLYDSHREAAGAQLEREPRELPVLSLGQDGPDLLTDFEYDLTGYDPHPKIPAPVAI